MDPNAAKAIAAASIARAADPVAAAAAASAAAAATAERLLSLPPGTANPGLVGRRHITEAGSTPPRGGDVGPPLRARALGDTREAQTGFAASREAEVAALVAAQQQALADRAAAARALSRARAEAAASARARAANAVALAVGAGCGSDPATTTAVVAAAAAGAGAGVGDDEDSDCDTVCDYEGDGAGGGLTDPRYVRRNNKADSHRDITNGNDSVNNPGANMSGRRETAAVAYSDSDDEEDVYYNPEAAAVAAAPATPAPKSGLSNVNSKAKTTANTPRASSPVAASSNQTATARSRLAPASASASVPAHGIASGRGRTARASRRGVYVDKYPVNRGPTSREALEAAAAAAEAEAAARAAAEEAVIAAEISAEKAAAAAARAAAEAAAAAAAAEAKTKAEAETLARRGGWLAPPASATAAAVDSETGSNSDKHHRRPDFAQGRPTNRPSLFVPPQTPGASFNAIYNAQRAASTSGGGATVAFSPDSSAIAPSSGVVDSRDDVSAAAAGFRGFLHADAAAALTSSQVDQLALLAGRESDVLGRPLTTSATVMAAAVDAAFAPSGGNTGDSNDDFALIAPVVNNAHVAAVGEAQEPQQREPEEQQWAAPRAYASVPETALALTLPSHNTQIKRATPTNIPLPPPSPPPVNNTTDSDNRNLPPAPVGPFTAAGAAAWARREVKPLTEDEEHALIHPPPLPAAATAAATNASDGKNNKRVEFEKNNSANDSNVSARASAVKAKPRPLFGAGCGDGLYSAYDAMVTDKNTKDAGSGLRQVTSTNTTNTTFSTAVAAGAPAASSSASSGASAVPWRLTAHFRDARGLLSHSELLASMAAVPVYSEGRYAAPSGGAFTALPRCDDAEKPRVDCSSGHTGNSQSDSHSASRDSHLSSDTRKRGSYDSRSSSSEAATTSVNVNASNEYKQACVNILSGYSNDYTHSDSNSNQDSNKSSADSSASANATSTSGQMSARTVPVALTPRAKHVSPKIAQDGSSKDKARASSPASASQDANWVRGTDRLQQCAAAGITEMAALFADTRAALGLGHRGSQFTASLGLKPEAELAREREQKGQQKGLSVTQENDEDDDDENIVLDLPMPTVSTQRRGHNSISNSSNNTNANTTPKSAANAPAAAPAATGVKRSVTARPSSSTGARAALAQNLAQTAVSRRARRGTTVTILGETRVFGPSGTFARAERLDPQTYSNVNTNNAVTKSDAQNTTTVVSAAGNGTAVGDQNITDANSSGAMSQRAARVLAQADRVFRKVIPKQAFAAAETDPSGIASPSKEKHSRGGNGSVDAARDSANMTTIGALEHDPDIVKKDDQANNSNVAGTTSYLHSGLSSSTTLTSAQLSPCFTVSTHSSTVHITDSNSTNSATNPVTAGSFPRAHRDGPGAGRATRLRPATAAGRLSRASAIAGGGAVAFSYGLNAGIAAAAAASTAHRSFLPPAAPAQASVLSGSKHVSTPSLADGGQRPSQLPYGPYEHAYAARHGRDALSFPVVDPATCAPLRDSRGRVVVDEATGLPALDPATGTVVGRVTVSRRGASHPASSDYAGLPNRDYVGDGARTAARVFGNESKGVAFTQAGRFAAAQPGPGVSVAPAAEAHTNTRLALRKPDARALLAPQSSFAAPVDIMTGKASTGGLTSWITGANEQHPHSRPIFSGPGNGAAASAAGMAEFTGHNAAAGLRRELSVRPRSAASASLVMRATAGGAAGGAGMGGVGFARARRELGVAYVAADGPRERMRLIMQAEKEAAALANKRKASGVDHASDNEGQNAPESGHAAAYSRGDDDIDGDDNAIMAQHPQHHHKGDQWERAWNARERYERAQARCNNNAHNIAFGHSGGDSQPQSPAAAADDQHPQSGSTSCTQILGIQDSQPDSQSQSQSPQSRSVRAHSSRPRTHAEREAAVLDSLAAAADAKRARDADTATLAEQARVARAKAAAERRAQSEAAEAEVVARTRQREQLWLTIITAIAAIPREVMRTKEPVAYLERVRARGRRARRTANHYDNANGHSSSSEDDSDDPLSPKRNLTVASTDNVHGKDGSSEVDVEAQHQAEQQRRRQRQRRDDEICASDSDPERADSTTGAAVPLTNPNIVYNYNANANTNNSNLNGVGARARGSRGAAAAAAGAVTMAVVTPIAPPLVGYWGGVAVDVATDAAGCERNERRRRRRSGKRSSGAGIGDRSAPTDTNKSKNSHSRSGNVVELDTNKAVPFRRTSNNTTGSNNNDRVNTNKPHSLFRTYNDSDADNDDEDETTHHQHGGWKADDDCDAYGYLHLPSYYAPPPLPQQYRVAAAAAAVATIANANPSTNLSASGNLSGSSCNNTNGSPRRRDRERDRNSGDGAAAADRERDCDRARAFRLRMLSFSARWAHARARRVRDTAADVVRTVLTELSSRPFLPLIVQSFRRKVVLIQRWWRRRRAVVRARAGLLARIWDAVVADPDFRREIDALRLELSSTNGSLAIASGGTGKAGVATVAPGGRRNSASGGGRGGGAAAAAGGGVIVLAPGRPMLFSEPDACYLGAVAQAQAAFYYVMLQRQQHHHGHQPSLYYAPTAGHLHVTAAPGSASSGKGRRLSGIIAPPGGANAAAATRPALERLPTLMSTGGAPGSESAGVRPVALPSQNWGVTSLVWDASDPATASVMRLRAALQTTALLPPPFKASGRAAETLEAAAAAVAAAEEREREADSAARAAAEAEAAYVAEARARAKADAESGIDDVAFFNSNSNSISGVAGLRALDTTVMGDSSASAANSVRASALSASSSSESLALASVTAAAAGSGAARGDMFDFGTAQSVLSSSASSSASASASASAAGSASVSASSSSASLMPVTITAMGAAVAPIVALPAGAHNGKHNSQQQQQLQQHDAAAAAAAIAAAAAETEAQRLLVQRWGTYTGIPLTAQLAATRAGYVDIARQRRALLRTGTLRAAGAAAGAAGAAGEHAGVEGAALGALGLGLGLELGGGAAGGWRLDDGQRTAARRRLWHHWVSKREVRAWVLAAVAEAYGGRPVNGVEDA